MPEYQSEEVQVSAEINSTVTQLVKLIQEAKMPEHWTNYCEQLSYNLQVHTKGLMFDKITGLYPNEHPDSQQHCIKSYESITKGSIWKAINNIIRVFNNSSYNITISEKVKEVIEKYQDSEGSLFSQFLEDWIKNAIATDPNGICVVYPLEYTEDLYRYVCYHDIRFRSADILIFKSETESEIKYELKTTECINEVFMDYEHLDGHPNVRRKTVKTYNQQLEKKYVKTVYHAFTKTHFFRFYKEDEGDKEYQYDFYKHPQEFETLPYFENGGVEVEKDIYESFVQPFVPMGNLCLMAHRNQRAIELMHAYPRMSEVQQACDTCNGTGETVCATGKETCKSCKGSKYVSIQSPYKVYRKVRDSFDVDGKVFDTPSVEYYAPPIGPMEFTNDLWQLYLSLAEEAVFVQQKTETGNVEAAKSKEIDREELYAWLANISKVLYNNLQMFLQYLEYYVNPSPIRVAVERPYSFAILTESEAFEALNNMLGSSVPVPIKASQIDNFVNKFISESSPVKRALMILKKYDDLLYYSANDVYSLKGNGFVDTKTCQIHFLAYPILIKMYERDKKLFDLDDDKIIQKLSAEVDKKDLTKDLKASVLEQD